MPRLASGAQGMELARFAKAKRESEMRSISLMTESACANSGEILGSMLRASYRPRRP
jgi:hypothetical protein